MNPDRYADGWRDACLSLAAAFDQAADDFTAVTESDWRGHLEAVTEADAPTTAKVFRRAAGIARQQAENGPADPAEVPQ